MKVVGRLPGWDLLSLKVDGRRKRGSKVDVWAKKTTHSPNNSIDQPINQPVNQLTSYLQQDNVTLNEP